MSILQRILTKSYILAHVESSWSEFAYNRLFFIRLILVDLNTTCGLSTTLKIYSKEFLKILLTQAVCRHIIGVAFE